MAYVKVRFYREFGWTPDELQRQSSSDIIEILTVWEVEGKVGKRRNEVGGKRGK